MEPHEANQQTELTVPEAARRTIRPPSRWARLCIFLCVALGSAIIASVGFGARGSAEFQERLAETLTKRSLYLGLAAWGLTNFVDGRWLTLKRTWITAISLYAVGFVGLAVSLPRETATDRVNKKATELQALGMRVADAQDRNYERPQDYIDTLLQIEPDVKKMKQVIAEITSDLNAVSTEQDVSPEQRWLEQELFRLSADLASLKASEIAVAHEMQIASAEEQERLFTSKLLPLLQQENELRQHVFDLKSKGDPSRFLR